MMALGIDIELSRFWHQYKSTVATQTYILAHLSLASFLWDIGKQYSPRCDAAERCVPSGAILFGKRIFIKSLYENSKLLLKVDNDGRILSSDMG